MLAYDVDGDGLQDAAIARGHGGAFKAAKATCCSVTPSVICIFADADYAYYGTEEAGWLGYQATGAGDVDGDGLADVMYGAHTTNSHQGRVYLIFGSSMGPSLQAAEAADVWFEGQGWSDQAGRSIAPAGEVDGDGRADILIGARNAGDRIGRGYLILGQSISAGVMDLADADMRFVGKALDEPLHRRQCGRCEWRRIGRSVVGRPTTLKMTVMERVWPISFWCHPMRCLLPLLVVSCGARRPARVRRVLVKMTRAVVPLDVRRRPGADTGDAGIQHATDGPGVGVIPSSPGGWHTSHMCRCPNG